MSEQIEYRNIPVGQVELRIEGNDRRFSGYANLHEVTDSYGTRFAPGSWSWGDEKIAYLWMHNPDNPVGTFTAREDERGLYIEGVYDDTDEGERARKRAQSGSAPGLSVGFIRRGVDPEDETRITAAELREVSQITRGFASQPGAELVAMRKAAEVMEEMSQRGGEVHPDSVGVVDPARPLTVANPGEAPPILDPTPVSQPLAVAGEPVTEATSAVVPPMVMTDPDGTPTAEGEVEEDLPTSTENLNEIPVEGSEVPMTTDAEQERAIARKKKIELRLRLMERK